jgi:hypothetical protein
VAVIRRNGWYLAGLTLFAAGVGIPAPRWMRVVVGAAGLLCWLVAIWFSARRPDHVAVVEDPVKIPRWLVRPVAVLCTGLGFCSVAYLTAAAAGHGFHGLHDSAQLDNGASFGNANAAFCGSVAFYVVGLIGWISVVSPRIQRREHAVVAVLSFNAVGIVGFVVVHAVIS